MVQMNKHDMQVLIQYCDTNNPRFELNYIYVDEKHAVSTNTRALAFIEHTEAIDKPFLVSVKAAVTAIKVQGAFRFRLEPNRIICLDSKDIEIVTISSQEPPEWRWTDYKRIIPESMAHTVRFAHQNEIGGVLVVNKVTIDNRFIPKIDGGYIGINSNSTPIMVQDEDKRIGVIIMPYTGFFDDIDYTSTRTAA